MISPRNLGWALAIAAFASSSSCKSPEDRLGSDIRRTDPVRVQVINQNFLDVTVRARGDGGELRLGDVVGKSSATFVIRPDQLSLASGLRLRADPIGSREVFLSPLIFPDRRGVVVLEVAPRLDMSTVRIR